MTPRRKAGASNAARKTCTAPKREDARTVRTRAALRAALVSLIEERGLEGFSVADLCERASVNRGTFYNHYRDKEDLLHLLEADALADLTALQAKMAGISILEVAAARFGGKPLPWLVELFEHIQADATFYCAVLGPTGDVGFGPRLRDSVCTNIIQMILHERYRENPTVFVNYYVAFFASAYLGIITRWLETGMHETPEEMARISVRLMFIEPGESIEL